MKKTFSLSIWLLPLLVGGGVYCSDHSDPLNPPEIAKNEGRLAGLFVFPDSEKSRLTVILTFFAGIDRVNRAAAEKGEKPKYEFTDIDLGIYLDFDSRVSYADSSFNQLYGGKIEDPAKIKPEASIVITLNDDGSLKTKTAEGFTGEKEKINLVVGLFDDPFILTSFAGRNVMALVADIPLNCLPGRETPILVWGQSHFGKPNHKHQIDLVGRAVRTMLPRFNKLNLLPPRLHVELMKKSMAKNSDLPDEEKLQENDLAPDVLILDLRKPAAFPNGRALEDDVVLKVHKLGDSKLYNYSKRDGPRATANDKAFRSAFPYLAEPSKN